MKSALPSWPAAPWSVAVFLGWLSFTGFYFLPSWLMRPLFFLTPAVGGQGLGGAPFNLRVGARGELYVLGSGSGWRFSGSWLERWWGWE